jgi:hypothetical protein
MPGRNTSLLRKFVNYGRKKFYNIGPRLGDEHSRLSIIDDEKKGFVLLQWSLEGPEDGVGEENFRLKTGDVGAEPAEFDPHGFPGTPRVDPPLFRPDLNHLWPKS